MTPLPDKPKAVVLLDTKGEPIAIASNISSNLEIKVVHDRTDYETEASNKPFDSTCPHLEKVGIDELLNS